MTITPWTPPIETRWLPIASRPTRSFRSLCAKRSSSRRERRTQGRRRRPGTARARGPGAPEPRLRDGPLGRRQGGAPAHSTTGRILRAPLLRRQEDPATNASRVARRVMQGGHDVPIPKIISRYFKSIANCAAVAREVDQLALYDNFVDGVPPRLVVRASSGKRVRRYRRLRYGLERRGSIEQSRGCLLTRSSSS